MGRRRGEQEASSGIFELSAADPQLSALPGTSTQIRHRFKAAIVIYRISPSRLAVKPSHSIMNGASSNEIRRCGCSWTEEAIRFSRQFFVELCVSRSPLNLLTQSGWEQVSVSLAFQGRSAICSFRGFDGTGSSEGLGGSGGPGVDGGRGGSGGCGGRGGRWRLWTSWKHRSWG